MAEKPILWAFWGHEPLAFYKRRNGNKRSLFGNGEWVESWYKRLHTEEAIARLADMGVNLIYTHFYKSMGMEFEKEEMQNTAKIVEIAHKYGMTVLGYATINCVYDEALACEIPDIDSMRIKRANGKESDNYRDYLCLNSRYYKEYYPKVLEYGIREIGLDGFHVDNAVAPICRCERCLEGFRNFLEENIADPRSVGLPSFKHVRLPMVPLVRGTDPVAIMALRYYRHLYESVFCNIYRNAKALGNGSVKILANNGFADSKIGAAQLGFEIALDKESDYLFIETPARFIGRDRNGELKNAIIAYKLASMTGKKVFNTLWQDFGVEPRTAAAMKRVIFEGMIFGSIVGTNWAARAVKHGSEMLLDNDLHYSTIRDAFHYFKKNCFLYSGKTLEDVQFLYLPDSRLISETAYDKTFYLAADILAENGAVYSITQLENIEVKNQTLIIPHAEYLSDKEVEEIRLLGEKGVKLIFLGEPGVYHENGEEREVYPFQQETIIPLPEDTPEAVAEFRKKLLQNLSRAVRLNKENIFVERLTLEDGSRAVHLLNPENENIVSDLVLTIPDEAGKFVKAVSPEPLPEISIDGDVIKISRLETVLSLIFK